MKYMILTYRESLDEFVDELAFQTAETAEAIRDQLEESGADAFIQIVHADGSREEYTS